MATRSNKLVEQTEKMESDNKDNTESKGKGKKQSTRHDPTRT